MVRLSDGMCNVIREQELGVLGRPGRSRFRAIGSHERMRERSVQCNNDSIFRKFNLSDSIKVAYRSDY